MTSRRNHNGSYAPYDKTKSQSFMNRLSAREVHREPTEATMVADLSPEAKRRCVGLSTGRDSAQSGARLSDIGPFGSSPSCSSVFPLLSEKERATLNKNWASSTPNTWRVGQQRPVAKPGTSASFGSPARLGTGLQHLQNTPTTSNQGSSTRLNSTMPLSSASTDWLNATLAADGKSSKSGNKKPSFNSSLYATGRLNCTSIVDTRRSTLSPFYSGRTIYGGSSSVLKPLTTTTNKHAASQPLDIFSPRRMEISNKTKVNASTMKPSNMQVELSASARKILTALEEFSAPIIDAKRLTLDGRGSTEPNETTTIGNRAQSIKRRYCALSHTLPTTPALMRLKRRQNDAQSSAKIEEIVRDSQSSSDSDDLQYPNDASGGGKQYISKAKNKKGVSNMDNTPLKMVNLPNVQLKMEALPKIDIPIRQHTTLNTVFKFSKPVLEGTKSSATLGRKESELGTPSAQGLNKPLNVAQSKATQFKDGKLTMDSADGSFKRENVLEKSGKAELDKKGMGFAKDWGKKEGSWTCEGCYVINEKEDKKCKSCESTRTGGELTRASANNNFGATFGKKEGEWICGTCMVRNTKDVKKCAACETDKPGEIKIAVSSHTAASVASNNWGSFFTGKKEGEWDCGSCLVKNGKDDKKCKACETPKPGEAISAVPLASSWGSLAKKEGEWSCDTCLIKNNKEDKKCKACETPKPGEKTQISAVASVANTGGWTFGMPQTGTELNKPGQTGTEFKMPDKSPSFGNVSSSSETKKASFWTPPDMSKQVNFNASSFNAVAPTTTGQPDVNVFQNTSPASNFKVFSTSNGAPKTGAGLINFGQAGPSTMEFGTKSGTNTGVLGAKFDGSSGVFGAKTDASLGVFAAKTDASSGVFGAKTDASLGVFGAKSDASSGVFGAKSDASSGVFGAKSDSSSIVFGAKSDASLTVSGAKPDNSLGVFGSKPDANLNSLGTKPDSNTSVFGAKSDVGASILGAKSVNNAITFGVKPNTTASIFGAQSNTTTSVFVTKSDTTSNAFLANSTDNIFGAKPDAAVNVFGTKSDTTASVFGAKSDAAASVFGAKSDTAASVFGTKSDTAASVFGTKSDTAASVFGAKSDPAVGVFGAKSDPAASVFGAKSDTAASVFGAKSDTTASVFGTKSNADASVFGTKSNPTSNAFGSPGLFADKSAAEKTAPKFMNGDLSHEEKAKSNLLAGNATFGNVATQASNTFGVFGSNFTNATGTPPVTQSVFGHSLSNSVATPTSSVNFDATKTASSPFGNSNSTNKTDTSIFNSSGFGTPSTTTPSFSSSMLQPAARDPRLAAGATPAKPSQQSGFTFGALNATTTTANQGFSFGATPSFGANATSAFGTASASTFGASTTSTPLFPSGTSTFGAHTFGSTAGAASFSFGSTTPFSNSATNSAPSNNVAFGGSQPGTTQPFGNQQSATATFGSATPFGTGSHSFGFGSVPITNEVNKGAATPFTFNAAPSVPLSFNFSVNSNATSENASGPISFTAQPTNTQTPPRKIRKAVRRMRDLR